MKTKDHGKGSSSNVASSAGVFLASKLFNCTNCKTLLASLPILALFILVVQSGPSIYSPSRYVINNNINPPTKEKQNVNPKLRVSEVLAAPAAVSQPVVATTTLKSESEPSLCSCDKETKQQSLENPSNSIPIDWCSKASSSRGPNQKVISYSLFGDGNSAYHMSRFYSLLENITISAHQIYPGWVVRFYHNLKSSDTKGLERLCKAYCSYENVDICSIADLADRLGTSNLDNIYPNAEAVRHLNQRMYRFLVMVDPNVDVFLLHDVDSIIIQREKDAVDEWLASNYTFHLMRDHPDHVTPILAGAYGAKLSQRRDDIEKGAKDMIRQAQNNVGTQDQTSLNAVMMPIMKSDVMVHDSYHCMRVNFNANGKWMPFPTKRDGSLFVTLTPHFSPGNQLDLMNNTCPIICRPKDHQDWQYC